MAARLSVSERTVQRHAAAGNLRYIRIGRSLRFDEADVAAFIERHRVG